MPRRAQFRLQGEVVDRQGKTDPLANYKTGRDFGRYGNRRRMKPSLKDVLAYCVQNKRVPARSGKQAQAVWES